MNDIVIYGAGGLGKEIACLIDRINRKEKQWNIIGFIDDGLREGTMISQYGKVLGNKTFLNSIDYRLAVVMAIGNPKTVKYLVDNISNRHLYFPNLIAPDVVIVDSSFKMGEGNVIQSSCWISCDVSIGNYNIFNGSVTLSHDNIVGSFNTFMPGVRISGEVEIGNGNFFGVGSIVLQQIKIGEDIKLGAGSVLMRKPKNGNLYIGNPAKIFKFE